LRNGRGKSLIVRFVCLSSGFDDGMMRFKDVLRMFLSSSWMDLPLKIDALMCPHPFPLVN
jgi:hypothetical protein